MTAQAGAIPNTSSAWDAVDWRTIEDNVRRLQARIVKAVQQKKWNKVKALQHLLTHSASGKLLAVRRVTGNDGRKTPGVDGELWDTPHKKLQGDLADGTGLSPRASAADLHPEGQWKAPTVRNPNDAGSSHASLVSAGASGTKPSVAVYRVCNGTR
jgi:hypothetical protein